MTKRKSFCELPMQQSIKSCYDFSLCTKRSPTTSDWGKFLRCESSRAAESVSRLKPQKLDSWRIQQLVELCSFNSSKFGIQASENRLKRFWGHKTTRVCSAWFDDEFTDCSAATQLRADFWLELWQKLSKIFIARFLLAFWLRENGFIYRSTEAVKLRVQKLENVFNSEKKSWIELWRNSHFHHRLAFRLFGSRYGLFPNSSTDELKKFSN